MHGAEDQFYAHIFHCEPSAGPLCKTIEAACKVGPCGYHMFNCSCGFKQNKYMCTGILSKAHIMSCLIRQVYSLTLYLKFSLPIKLNNGHNLKIY